MREVDSSEITRVVARLCIESNCVIDPAIREAFEASRSAEELYGSSLGRDVLDMLLENARIASDEGVPICQDTGMAVVFVTLGQDAHVTGSLEDAVNEGVRVGYEKGFLRKSVVRDPIDRVNTGDNTPAVIHYEVVPGDSIRITVAPKGFGSENMSRLAMLSPSAGVEGVKSFVVETVRAAGPNPCPPVVVGVGVGGTMEYAALLAKRALLRPVGTENKRAFWAGVEAELLGRINGLGIGPAGLGGATTALAVHIETFPTHIAGLPVAVNIGCHVTRHAEAVI